jgi:ribose-phosphate pyrophosphokinase
MSPESPLKVFAGPQATYLGEKIAKYLGKDLGRYTMHRFSDGECQPAYEESVRGCSVFIIQSTFQPTDNLVELLLLIDAAKRASAQRVVAVIPYFGYARQDRKDKPRASIGAKLVANLLSASGVDRVMTLDLHAGSIQGFFDIPVDHLSSSPIFVPYIKNLGLNNLVVAAPDVGGSKRANLFARFLNSEMVICYKSRSEANTISDYKVIGDINNKDVVIFDDMIDTAGTVSIAANMMEKEGAASVRVVATHPVLSGPAIERIERSFISEVVVTDSIPLIDKEKCNCKKIKVLTIAETFAQVIEKVYNHQSISTHFLV